MPRAFGVVFLVALMFWALLGMFAGRALGNHIQCGDVITQDTTLDSDHGDDGLDIDVGGTTLTRNLALRNLDLGIEAVPDVIDGGANLAFRNGNPLQCLNVDCRRP